MMLLSVFITASLFAYCSNLHHLSGVLHIFHRSALLSYSKNLLFRNAYTTKDDIIALLTARSLDYCCNLEALLSWYKYLLFRNAYTTAGCALLGSRNDLLILLQQQPFSFRWSAWLLSTLSTFVSVQVSSQECLHHSGTCSSRIS